MHSVMMVRGTEVSWKDRKAHLKWLNGYKLQYTCIKYHKIHKNSQNSNISFIGGQLEDKLLPYQLGIR